jgi:hypothetical protein
MINYLKVYYLNVKVCMILKKRMIISKLLGWGLPPPAPPIATTLDRV